MAQQDYYTILTSAGLAYEANRKALGLPIKLTQMSVGDGNGAVYNPSASQTALAREVWRGPINALLQDATNPTYLVGELTLPDDVGGWYVREVGFWTDSGILYAIGKYPESFKPELSAGAGKEFYIRAIFETSNAESVTLVVDDTVVKATRAYVIDYVAAELAKRDGKHSVRVATTGAINLVAAQTIDGVAVVAGDRVLVKDQAVGSQNGIYVVAAGAWSRAADADVSVEVTPGLFVPVEEGVTNGDSVWHLVTNAPITLNTTALAFELLAGRSGVSVGTYQSVTVDKFGRVIAGTVLEGLPLSALPFPTIATNDVRIAVTSTAVAGSGGTVSVPAGVRIALCEELVAGVSARQRSMITTAWTSAPLAANSTYYLRANIQAGDLVIYVGTGTDADAVPAAQRTSAGAVACGYDSTVIDMLIAKVVTGAAGTAPTVTALANKASLRADAGWQGAAGTYPVLLNWARKPRGYVTSFADFDGNQKTDYSVVIEPLGNVAGGGPIQPVGGFSDRYTGRIYIASYIPGVGNGLINVAVRWEA